MKPRTRLSAIALALGMLTAPQFAQAQGTAQRLFFEGDMVRGPGAGPACVLSSQFKHGQHIVWRLRIRDQTGTALDNKELKSVAVELPDGKTFAMHYGGHPKGKTDDFFWTTSWQVPANYPTGTFGYKVVATTVDGKTQTWSPFNVKLSELTIVK